jgi:hypothetical protein
VTLNSSPSGPSAAAEIARRALEEVCSNRDDAGFDELYAENFVDHVNGTTYHGRDGARRSVAGIGACSATAIGSVSWSSSSTGDRVCSRFTVTGTYRGRSIELWGPGDQPRRQRPDRGGLGSDRHDPGAATARAVAKCPSRDHRAPASGPA